MRNVSSLFMLLVRISLPWLLLLILLVGLAEGLLFHMAFERNVTTTTLPLFFPGVEWLLSEGGLPWAVGAGFLLSQLLLVMGPWPEQSSILLRLRISGRGRFFTHSLYHFLCCCLLWMAQILILWGLCLIYVKRAGPEAASNQAIFLAFHRNHLLHTLLPLTNGFLWARNLLALLSLSLGLSFHTLRKPTFYLRMLIVLRILLVCYALGPKGLELGFLVFDTVISLGLTGLVLHKVFLEKEGLDDAAD